MIIRHRNRVVGKGITAIVLMLALVPIGMCQTSTAQNASPETSEEIVVYGKKSLVRLRSELYSAERDFLGLFNSLNSVDDFDIECEYVTYLGSRARHHICTPNFIKRSNARSTSRVMDDLKSPAGHGGGLVSNQYRERTDKKLESIWSEMATLILEHPELDKEYIELASAKQAFNSELEIRRQKR